MATSGTLLPAQKPITHSQAGTSEDFKMIAMNTKNLKLSLIYWKSDKFWLGKLVQYPEIMTQGETLEELEENIKDAYLMMLMEDVPENYETKELTL